MTVTVDEYTIHAGVLVFYTDDGEDPRSFKHTTGNKVTYTANGAATQKDDLEIIDADGLFVPDANGACVSVHSSFVSTCGFAFAQLQYLVL